MYNIREVVKDIYYIGVDDHRLHLFENIHPIQRGVSYNSYILLDEKTVLFDTVDWSVGRQFLSKLKTILDGRTLDYMIINHMEPDHAVMMEEVILRYPDVKIISTARAFTMMNQFGIEVDSSAHIVVKEGDKISFGSHEIAFVEAPMVHWPEAMVSFDLSNGVLFSSDAFGSFGALDGKLFNDEVDFDRYWIDDARRYYTNIVGKYGPQVQALLKKASTLPIKYICPLHGPIWRNDFEYLLDKYVKWSTYEYEEKGVVIAYATMYGNTEEAANLLASQLVQKGMTNVFMYDVSTTHVSQLISETFKYSHLVLASPTYNLEMYPLMHDFLNHMKELNVQKKTVGIIENGTWACKSGTLMTKALDKLKNINLLTDVVSIASSVNENSVEQSESLAEAIIKSMED